MFSALRCSICRGVFRPSSGGAAGESRSYRTCQACQIPEARPRRAIQATDHLQGEIQDVIRGLKYRNQRWVVAELADQLVRSVLADPDAPVFDVVTWAPTSDRRQRQRGYDQSELLARAVASRL
ncbi:MAG: hypothetical protein RIS69_284, partial [Actinomycetota bacterium]